MPDTIPLGGINAKCRGRLFDDPYTVAGRPQRVRAHRSTSMPLVAVCAVWGVFRGVWGGLLPAVQRQIGGSLADLGLALVAIPIGGIPPMIFARPLARGRGPPVLATVVAAFAMPVAALAVPATPGRLPVTLAAAGMAIVALDV